MIRLSYSSLNILHTCPHNWLNKQMGIQAEEKPEWEEGKICHRIIQDHVARIKTDKRLKHILEVFPVVEERDFDLRCKFMFIVKNCEIIGFYDGRKNDYSGFLEIKSSSSPWSLGKFQKSMQRKLYALSDKRLKNSTLITGQRDPKLWKKQPPKVFKVPITDQDRQDAKEWILEGLRIFKSGNFTSDLVDGKCTDYYCWWGKNCSFKNV